MPKKPNYNFEKQQKERARDQKKAAKAEEKRLRKLANREGASDEVSAADDSSAGSGEEA